MLLNNHTSDLNFKFDNGFDHHWEIKDMWKGNVNDTNIKKWQKNKHQRNQAWKQKGKKES